MAEHGRCALGIGASLRQCHTGMKALSEEAISLPNRTDRYTDEAAKPMLGFPERQALRQAGGLSSPCSHTHTQITQRKIDRANPTKVIESQLTAGKSSPRLNMYTGIAVST